MEAKVGQVWRWRARIDHEVGDAARKAERDVEDFVVELGDELVVEPS